jgi:NAD(P)-dependent dehydrogenase (short-subunit alcohol dehydrogenase family)
LRAPSAGLVVVRDAGNRSARFACYRHVPIAPIGTTCHRGGREPRCSFSPYPLAVDLTGKVALVTGTRRIGAEVATHLARRGADVALSYWQSANEAQRAVDAVRAEGRRGLAVQADLREAAACRDLVARAVEGLGRLDVLVALASVYERVPFDTLTERDWDAGLAVDLSASFFCAQAAVPHMRAQGGGHIILFSDWLATSGRPRYKGYVPYYVAKAGVTALGEALALELAPDHILVNTIAPGPILPAAGSTDESNRAILAATPLARWGGGDSIATAVLALIEHDFITGEQIRVDGGRHLL